jgi:hypothetical protein
MSRNQNVPFRKLNEIQTSSFNIANSAMKPLVAAFTIKALANSLK